MSGLKLVRHQAEQDKLIEARVKKAGDTMTGNLTMNGTAKVIGNLQGNSDTATRLQTARTINGTSFNGTSINLYSNILYHLSINYITIVNFIVLSQ